MIRHILSDFPRFKMVRKYLKKWLMRAFHVPGARRHGHWLFGQGLEDAYLMRIFRGRSSGWYVDVGANDGVFISNTFALYRLGWRGICLEPHPQAHAKLLANRPRDICLQCAVGNQNGEVELAWDGDVSEGARIGGRTRSGHSAKVAIRRLADILGENNVPKDFDLLSIDVEGMEIEVLDSLDWSQYSPRVIIVEYNSGGVVDHATFDYLLAKGYRPVMINRWNFIMSRAWSEDVIAAHSSQDWFDVSA